MTVTLTCVSWCQEKRYQFFIVFIHCEGPFLFYINNPSVRLEIFLVLLITVSKSYKKPKIVLKQIYPHLIKIQQKTEALLLLKAIGKAMRRSSFIRQLNVIPAKCPIIKFHDSHK